MSENDIDFKINECKDLLQNIYKDIELKKDTNPDLDDIYILIKGYELLIFELENKKSFVNYINLISALDKIKELLFETLKTLDNLKS